MVETLINTDDDEWVRLVGRYILNMGILEMATREWIAEDAGRGRSCDDHRACKAD